MVYFIKNYRFGAERWNRTTSLYRNVHMLPEHFLRLWSETKELNPLLRPGRPVCYRYTNLAYIITDENTHVKEPAFVGLLFPNFSTTFWVVPIQCGLVKPTTHKVTNYSLFTPLLLFCRTD